MHEHKQNQCKRKVKLFTKKLALTYCYCDVGFV